MKRHFSALVLLALWMTACGAQETGGLGIVVQGVSLSEVGQIQLAVVGETTECGQVAMRCLGDQSAVKFVPLRHQGREVTHLRLLFTSAAPPDAGTVIQRLEITELEVAVGRNYVLVVEALSASGAFLGNHCEKFQDPVSTGNNPGALQTAVILELPATAPACTKPVL